MTRIAMKLMELFEHYRGRLRVHEANAEVAIEIGGVPIPIAGVSWRSRKLSGWRQYTMVLHPDADELGRPGGPGRLSEGTDLLRPLGVPGDTGDAGDACA
jgi:hypothetical protein